MTATPTLTIKEGISIVTVIGKEYLDGISFKMERIEIKFRQQKIISFRAFNLK